MGARLFTCRSAAFSAVLAGEAGIRGFIILIASPLAIIGSQGLAQSWAAIGATGIRVDKNTLRHGADGLVYFTDNIRLSSDTVGITEKLAMDCSRHLTYLLKSDGSLSGGRTIDPNSIEDAEFKYVCADSP